MTLMKYSDLGPGCLAKGLDNAVDQGPRFPGSIKFGGKEPSIQQSLPPDGVPCHTLGVPAMHTRCLRPSAMLCHTLPTLGDPKLPTQQGPAQLQEEWTKASYGLTVTPVLCMPSP